jgi:hypothetical protein
LYKYPNPSLTKSTNTTIKDTNSFQILIQIISLVSLCILSLEQTIHNYISNLKSHKILLPPTVLPPSLDIILTPLLLPLNVYYNDIYISIINIRISVFFITNCIFYSIYLVFIIYG